MDSTWAWRLPSAIQGLFSVFCVILLLFVLESPHWLANRGKQDQALAVIAYTHANGDRSSVMAIEKFSELQATVEYEKTLPKGPPFKIILKTPLARKRLLLALSVGLFAASMGAQVKLLTGCMED